MSWFDRFKRSKEEIHTETRDLPVSTLVRWFLYDTDIAEPNQVVSFLGLNPVSEEGDLKEIEDSDERLFAIADIFPYLDTIAEITANSIVAAQLSEAGEEHAEEAPLHIMIPLYKLIAQSALVSGFASAVELGILQKDTVTALSFIDREDYDE